MKNIVPFENAKVTATSLEITPGLPYKQWEKIGETIRFMEGAVHWWIGDWLNYGEKRYGEKYSQALEVTDYEYGTLAHDSYVAKNIEICRRRQKLTWSHHAEVAALEPEEQECLLDLAEKNNWTRHELRSQVRQHRRDVSSPAAELEIDGSVLVGDMREIGTRIPDNSIDLILTDPPYPAEFVPLFSDLSRLALRVLRPGGLCLTYSGQIHLPEIYSRMGECLEYLWTFAIRHTGGAQRIFKANVNTAWKPVLAYTKHPFTPYWDSFIDVVSGGMEKDLHEWQQSEAEAAYFIEHLCPQKGIVLDPFCGSGTVLVAAGKLGRQYIGIEIEEGTAANASRRLQ